MAPAAAADFSVMTRTARILTMESYMRKSIIGVLGVLIGFGMVISKVYLSNSFTYGITFVLMTASTMLASHFQIKAATLRATQTLKSKKAASTVSASSRSLKATEATTTTVTTIRETVKDVPPLAMSPAFSSKKLRARDAASSNN